MPDPYSAAERCEIERRVIDGLQIGRTLAELCREEGMPDRVTIYRWRDEDDVLAQRIARARDAGFDAIAEKGLEIVDDLTEDPASRRVRSEYRLKLLAKWDPKRYGELLKLGGDERTPLKVIQAPLDDKL